MVEILFFCGSAKRAVVATLGVLSHHADDGSKFDQNEVMMIDKFSGNQFLPAHLGCFSFTNAVDATFKQMVTKALEGLSIESAPDLQKVLRVNAYASQTDAFHHLIATLPVFRSRMGAILFLISALLSRGLVCATVYNFSVYNTRL